MMVTKELSEAAVELNCILSNASPEIIKKIPKSFINFMKNIASTTYKFDYDKSKKLNEQTLKLETRGLISLVYSDYICNDKEKEEYINKCQNHLKIKEQESSLKYNPDNLFKKSKEGRLNYANNTIAEEMAIVECKEKNLVQKILDKIRHLFEKNKKSTE